jgi:hypothetical protein
MKVNKDIHTYIMTKFVSFKINSSALLRVKFGGLVIKPSLHLQWQMVWYNLRHHCKNVNDVCMQKLFTHNYSSMETTCTQLLISHDF